MFNKVNLYGSLVNNPEMQIYANEGFPDFWDKTSDKDFLERELQPYKGLSLNLLPPKLSQKHLGTTGYAFHPDHAYVYDLDTGDKVEPGVSIAIYPRHEHIIDAHNHITNILTNRAVKQRLQKLSYPKISPVISRLINLYRASGRYRHNLTLEDELANFLDITPKEYSQHLDEHFNNIVNQRNTTVDHNHPTFGANLTLASEVPAIIRHSIIEGNDELPSTKMSLTRLRRYQRGIYV
jgi:hypothetical protein